MEIKKEVIIKNNGSTFSAHYEAEQLLKSEGFVVGSMCRDEPIGFADAKQYNYVAKWYNLSANDKKLLSGIMTSNDWREGDVKITYYMDDAVQF